MLRGRKKQNAGALSDLYTPDAAVAGGGGHDLASTLIASGAVSSDLVANAQSVLKQSPGRSLGEVLIEMGSDEADVLKVVAEFSRLGFERVNAEAIDSYDAKAVQKLTPKYCQQNQVLPLRREMASR